MRRGPAGPGPRPQPCSGGAVVGPPQPRHRWPCRGHRAEEAPELPLVAEDKVESYKKTKQAVLLLKKRKAWNGIKKVYASQRMRAGKGKTRNHRRIQRRGPSLIYNETSLELLRLMEAS
ncbi:hypothetical protein MJT46_010421 [Ovis ammon polii x Ovis aries]|nr:hypothetical protein MJT46_010421 [Ovis ammon polii x Ovis aries]